MESGKSLLVKQFPRDDVPLNLSLLRLLSGIANIRHENQDVKTGRQFLWLQIFDCRPDAVSAMSQLLAFQVILYYFSKCCLFLREI
jgi:hypothetical protein